MLRQLCCESNSLFTLIDESCQFGRVEGFDWGTKYCIIFITQLHNEKSLVHLEGREGDRVYTLWPVRPFDSEDVDSLNTARIRCTMMCRGRHHINVLSIILDKLDVSA